MCLVMFFVNFFCLKTDLRVNQVFTPLCDIDHMLEDIKIQVRCISIWFSEEPNRSHCPLTLAFVVQDDGMWFFLLIMLYFILNFGVT